MAVIDASTGLEAGLGRKVYDGLSRLINNSTFECSMQTSESTVVGRTQSFPKYPQFPRYRTADIQAARSGYDPQTS